jgi:hypothetical protein
VERERDIETAEENGRSRLTKITLSKRKFTESPDYKEEA